MKVLLLTTLAALAAATPEAEADPYLLYGNYPYTHGYPYHFPYTAFTQAVSKPVEDIADTKTADTKTAITPTVYSSYHPYTYRQPVVRLTEGKPILSPLTTLRYPYHYIAKREAEAEPEAEADPYLIYGNYPHGNYQYGNYPYTHGLVHSPYFPFTQAVSKSSEEVDTKAVEEKKLASPIVYGYGGYGSYGYPYNYGGYGLNYAFRTPHHYITKRNAEAEPEAEAEADPYLIYGNYPYGNYLHGNYPYGNYPYTHGVVHPKYFPFTHQVVSKPAEEDDTEAVEEKKAAYPPEPIYGFGYNPYNIYGAYGSYGGYGSGYPFGYGR